MSRPANPGEVVRFGQPTFGAPIRRSRPSRTRVSTAEDFRRLAERRAEQPPQVSQDSPGTGVARLAARRAAVTHPTSPTSESAPGEGVARLLARRALASEENQ